MGQPLSLPLGPAACPEGTALLHVLEKSSDSPGPRNQDKSRCVPCASVTLDRLQEAGGQDCPARRPPKTVNLCRACTVSLISLPVRVRVCTSPVCVGNYQEKPGTGTKNKKVWAETKVVDESQCGNGIPRRYAFTKSDAHPAC